MSEHWVHHGVWAKPVCVCDEAFLSKGIEWMKFYDYGGVKLRESYRRTLLLWTKNSNNKVVVENYNKNKDNIHLIQTEYVRVKNSSCSFAYKRAIFDCCYLTRMKIAINPLIHIEFSFGSVPPHRSSIALTFARANRMNGMLKRMRSLALLCCSVVAAATSRSAAALMSSSSALWVRSQTSFRRWPDKVSHAVARFYFQTKRTFNYKTPN